MFYPRILQVCLLVCCLSLLAACGPSNSVRLLHPPLDSSVLPAPNAPRITVVSFTDKREDSSALGMRRDGSSFTASEDVAAWISRALADELGRHALQVSFATNANQARSANPDYMVTGALEEAWLKESSATELAASLCAQFTLANRAGRMLRETLNSSQSRTGLPSGAAAENLLLDTLRDLVKPMAQKIVQTIQPAK